MREVWLSAKLSGINEFVVVTPKGDEKGRRHKAPRRTQ
uniref:Uncharacterized protein n=1 Tax=Morganella morganii TaxID=582 RepID=A0A514C8T4_MORMO|nr:hypothetical protein [Morganella morganii]